MNDRRVRRGPASASAPQPAASPLPPPAGSSGLRPPPLPRPHAGDSSGSTPAAGATKLTHSPRAAHGGGPSKQPWDAEALPRRSRPVDLSSVLVEQAVPPQTHAVGTATDEFWPRIPGHVLDRLPQQPHWDRPVPGHASTSRLTAHQASQPGGVSSQQQQQQQHSQGATTSSRDVCLGVTPSDLGMVIPEGGDPGPPQPTAQGEGGHAAAIRALRVAILAHCRSEDAAPLIAQIDAAVAAQAAEEAAHAEELTTGEARLLRARAARAAARAEEGAALIALLQGAREKARAVEAATKRHVAAERAGAKLEALAAARELVRERVYPAVMDRLWGAGFLYDPVERDVRRNALARVYAALAEGPSSVAVARITAEGLLDRLLAEVVTRQA